MTPERLDHMTVQYIWALENDQAFMVKIRHEVDRGNFTQFRVLVSRFIMPIRRMLDEERVSAFSRTEWAYLYLELWHRLGGKPHDFAHSEEQSGYDLQMDRLREGGYCLTTRGVMKSTIDKSTIDTSFITNNAIAGFGITANNACFTTATFISNSNGETTMNDNYAKTPSATATLRPAFETKSYIFGNDVERMTEEGLIISIKRVEEQIADLKAVKTKSTKIAANIAKLEEQLASIVAELDKR